jgi:hypothetical protein
MALSGPNLTGSIAADVAEDAARARTRVLLRSSGEARRRRAAVEAEAKEDAAAGSARGRSSDTALIQRGVAGVARGRGARVDQRLFAQRQRARVSEPCWIRVLALQARARAALQPARLRSQRRVRRAPPAPRSRFPPPLPSAPQQLLYSLIFAARARRPAEAARACAHAPCWC